MEIQLTVRLGAVMSKMNCARGATLRNVLIENGQSPNRGIHCSGLGICGTCLVEVVEEGGRQRKRACQIRCFRNLEIILLS